MKKLKKKNDYIEQLIQREILEKNKNENLKFKWKITNNIII